MADRPILSLPPAEATDLSDDAVVLHIVNPNRPLDADKNRIMTRLQLPDFLPDGSVDGVKLTNATVTDVKLAYGINAAKIGGGTVGNTVWSRLANITSDVQAQLNSKVPETRSIFAGNGLTGGGTLTGDRTLGIAAGGVDTPELADDAVTPPKTSFLDQLGAAAKVYMLNVLTSGTTGVFSPSPPLPAGWSITSVAATIDWGAKYGEVTRVNHFFGTTNYMVMCLNGNPDVSDIDFGAQDGTIQLVKIANRQANYFDVLGGIVTINSLADGTADKVQVQSLPVGASLIVVRW